MPMNSDKREQPASRIPGGNTSSSQTNRLDISYHISSSVGLDEAGAMRLGQLLSESGIEVSIESFYPWQGNLLSVIPPPRYLTIILNGMLARRPALARVAQDIFRFYSENLKRFQKEKEVEHFAVILDLRVEGKRHYVGIDFKDEKTLAINCYRLAQYLDSPKSGTTPHRLVELEYPKNINPSPLEWGGYLLTIVFGAASGNFLLRTMRGIESALWAT